MSSRINSLEEAIAKAEEDHFSPNKEFNEAADILLQWLSIDLTDEREISPLAVITHQFLIKTGKFPVHDKRIS